MVEDDVSSVNNFINLFVKRFRPAFAEAASRRQV